MTNVSRSTVRGSLKWAYLMTWARRVMTAGVTLVLAAILGPREFGVVVLATIFISLLSVMVEQGLMTAIVQREDLEDSHLDAAFWMNIAWCTVLAALAVALSWWWADLNRVPEIQPMVAALSVVLLLRGLVLTQAALLERQLKYKLLGLRTNVATLVGGVVGITLALAGLGAWALVFQTIAFDLVAVVTLYAVSDWRPRLRFSRRHAHDLLGYSVNVFFSNLATFFYRRSDALLLGVFCGPHVVGIYRLCDRLVDTTLAVTMRPIGVVSLPYFSRLQNDRDELRRAVHWSIRLSLTAAIPSLLLLAALSPWVLGAIGSEWTAGTTALKWLCVVGIAKAAVNFAGPLLFAVDRPRMRAGTAWALALTSAASVTVVGLAIRDAEEETQILAMSASRAFVFVAIVVPLNLFVVHRVTGLSPRGMRGWLRGPVVSGALALAVGGALTWSGVLDGLPPWIALLVAGAVTSGVSLTALVALDDRVRAQASRALRRRRRGVSSAGPPTDAPASGPDIEAPAALRRR